MLDPYYLLGLPHTATAHEIRAAYRRKAAATHPDHQPPDQRAAAEEQMKQLNAARDLLLDPRRRATYDDQMRLEMQKAMWRARRDSAIFEEAFAPAPSRPRRRPPLTSGWFIAWTILLLFIIMVFITAFALAGTDTDLGLSFPLVAFLWNVRCFGSGLAALFITMLLLYILSHYLRS